MSRIEAILAFLTVLATLLASLPHVTKWLNRRASARRTDAATDRDSAEAESKRVEAADKLIDQLQEEYARFSKEHESARHRQNDLVGHIATLEHKLDDEAGKVRKLEEQVLVLLQENAGLKKAYRELGEELDRTTVENTALLRRLEEELDVHTTLKAEIAEMRDMRGGFEVRIAKLEEERESLLARVNELERELAWYRKQYGARG